jgi:hypothetical protein
MRLPQNGVQGVSLIEPLAPSRREQLSRELNAAHGDLQRLLRQGRPRAEFPALQSLLLAVETAQSILTQQDG